MYTVTPNRKPIIDYYSKNVILGVGFSGSGFKHSPASGKMLVCLALNRKSSIPRGFLLAQYGLPKTTPSKTVSWKLLKKV
eukprot:UN00673